MCGAVTTMLQHAGAHSARYNQGGIATAPVNGRDAFGSHAITVNSVFCCNAIHYGGNTDVALSVAALNDNGRVKDVYQNAATIQRSCMFVVFGK